jgi:hypothetical protein
MSDKKPTCGQCSHYRRAENWKGNHTPKQPGRCAWRFAEWPIAFLPNSIREPIVFQQRRIWHDTFACQCPQFTPKPK